MEPTFNTVSAANLAEAGATKQTLNVNAIRTDGGTQSRVKINNEVVADYAESMQAGVEFPPVVVFHDGADYWLAGGFHRLGARKQAGKATIVANVRSGSQLDAKLFAVGANGAHGLRRTTEDKRNAVQMVLDEPAWATWSDRNVAEACGVSVTFVSGLRRPQVAAKRNENRVKAAARVLEPVDKRSPATPADPLSPVVAQPTSQCNSVLGASELTSHDELAELRALFTDLAQENEILLDRLAVEAMDASEEEKMAAAETIGELRTQVKTLEAEVDVLKVSRDTYMCEAAEAKKEVLYWRQRAQKVGAVP